MKYIGYIIAVAIVGILIAAHFHTQKTDIELSNLGFFGIEPGQVWEYNPPKNPFQKYNLKQINTVIAVKDGWVQYSCVSENGTEIQSDTIWLFRAGSTRIK